MVAAAQTGAPKVATEFCGKKLAAGIALGMLGDAWGDEVKLQQISF